MMTSFNDVTKKSKSKKWIAQPSTEITLTRTSLIAIPFNSKVTTNWLCGTDRTKFDLIQLHYCCFFQPAFGRLPIWKLVKILFLRVDSQTLVDSLRGAQFSPFGGCKTTKCCTTKIMLPCCFKVFFLTQVVGKRKQNLVNVSTE